jgi:hypothetical protein
VTTKLSIEDINGIVAQQSKNEVIYKNGDVVKDDGADIEFLNMGYMIASHHSNRSIS